MSTAEADVAIVGSGVSGLLVARSLLKAGRRVTIVERGELKTHAEQFRDRSYTVDMPSTRPNHETAPGSPDYPWDYVYGVGGSSLHWDAATPRFHPNDFRMRSRFGVMVDWPLSYAELLPYYRRAEQALAVAGARDHSPLPAHPFSPMDRLVAPHLAPYVPFPQARPTRPVRGNPACCGSATCELCPVDARFSALNGLADVIGHPHVDLRKGTVAARVRLDPGGRSAASLECLGRGNTPLSIRARTFVLAANGLENPGLLLRSGLDGAAVGRYLFDHTHRNVQLVVRARVSAGVGTTLSTGESRAFVDGPFRSRRSSALLSPYNPGVTLGELAVDAAVAGRNGRALRREVVDRWEHTLPIDTLLEDVPRAERRVTLSRRRDSFGLPLNRVAYPPEGPYERRGIGAVRDELERRLASLGIREIRVVEGRRGGHTLGTCRMGPPGEAVVDRDLRHHQVENLFVAGGSAFPTYSPAHPTLTISALAIRLGDHLAAA
jgi:choline dehydrogenase-like flavoprotein